MNVFRSLLPRVFGLAMIALAPLAPAADNLSSPAKATRPEGALVDEFSAFAGSRENSAALVGGIRNGSSITLVPAEGQGGTPTTFSTPTKPMGYGNTRIALSLAEARLANEGVTNPTTQQIQGALTGPAGSEGTQAGVLQMRASGMGWGQIANSMGFKLGEVMSGRQVQAVPAQGAAASGAKNVPVGAGGAPAGKGQGVTTAGGEPAGKGGGVTNAAGASAGKSGGVTTATGSKAGGVTTGQGAGNAYGKTGTVNAAGVQPGAGGGGGQGKGGGKP